MAEHSQFELLRERRFAPFFWTQFLGAGNDNVYKNALVIFVAYQAAALTALDRRTTWSTSPPRSSSCRSCCSPPPPASSPTSTRSRASSGSIKIFEIAIMVVGAVGFYRRDLVLLFVALVLMGVHSTLFGPVKYAILPQHLRRDELVGGNGLVEMGTFVAILLGTIVGGLVVAIEPARPDARGRRRHRDRDRRLARESRAFPPTPAVGAGPAHQLEPVHRDRGATCASRTAIASSGCRCSASRGSGSTARPSSRSSPTSPRTCWAATSTSSRCCSRSFSVGIGVGSLLCERLSGRKVEIGLVPVRLDRPDGVRGRPVAREPRPARRRAVPASAAFLARSARTGASSPTSSCSASSAASTSCRCTR